MKVVTTKNSMISTDILNVCSAYQRNLNRSRVNKIVKHFDADAFGSLTVGKRPDGSLWVVDGFHRLEVAKKLNILKVACDIFLSSGQSHEAKIFRTKNTERASVSSKNVFKARLIEGDPQAIEISKVAEKHGLKINTSTGGYGWPWIDATSMLDRSYEKIGGDGLSRVFNVIVQSWKKESSALLGDVIGGLAILIYKHPELDDERLISKLTNQAVSVIRRSALANFELLKADRSTNVNSDAKGQGMYLSIKHIYNSGLRKGKLV